MNAGVVAVLLGLGVGAWVFNYMSHRTGNNSQASGIIAVVVGLIAIFVFYTLVRFVFGIGK